MSAAAAEIRPRQTWKDPKTGHLVNVISYLDQQGQVVISFHGVGAYTKMDVMTFRRQYRLSRASEPKKVAARAPVARKGSPKAQPPKARRGAPEKALVASILARLELMPGVEAWRNNTGAFKAEATATTRRKFVRFGAPGSGDVFVVISPHGRFLSVEAKAPNGRERETQKRWRQKMRRVGASSIVVRSVDEVVAAIVAIQNET